MATKTTLPTTDPNYPRFVQIGVQLTEHRRAMRALKKERAQLLGQPVQATRGANVTAAEKAAGAVAAGTPPVTPQATPAAAGEAFSAVPAGTRGKTGQAEATISLYAQVRSFFEKNPGVVHSASTVATALGLGQSLQRPVGEAIKKLAKEKVVREMARGKYAHVEMATNNVAT